MSETPSPDVLANELNHLSRGMDEVKGTTAELLALVRSMATKDEVRAGDAVVLAEVAALRTEVNGVKTLQTAADGEQRAHGTRIRALEDARTASKAQAGLLWAVVGLLGLTGIGALLRVLLGFVAK